MSTQSSVPNKCNPDAVQITDANLQNGILIKHQALLRNVKCWHRFIVSNTEGLNRDQILKAILDHVHPLDLIPVFYSKDSLNSNAYFMARNCEQAIEKLCRDKLVVDHPFNKKSDKGNFTPFKLSIILNYANTTDVQISVQKNVLNVLNKRFDSFSKVLNLNKFHEDPDLTEFCTLSQPKIMYFVMHIAKSLNPEGLILSDNGIKLLNPLKVLMGFKLRSVDLSGNELNTFDDLETLKYFHLKVLKLTGNKLCDCDEAVYVSKIKELCPSLESLDSTILVLDKFPPTKKNFLCDFKGMDLVNQFLEYFFTIYDSRDRSHLSGLYHPTAMFSLTCVYLSGQLSSSTTLVKLYSTFSRNLKKSADFSKTAEYLYQGRHNIMDMFCKEFPQTEHDPYSFTADLMHQTDTCAVIVVTGVFREKASSLLEKERFLGFFRSFVLAKINSGYVITNEQLHVYNGLTYQEQNSFLEPIELNRAVHHKPFLPKPQTNSDFADLITTMARLTNLNEDWAKKCLEERSYDLKCSLELFVDLYKADRIPKHAFID